MGLTLAAGGLTLDRLHWFNHWISAETAHRSETVFIVSAAAMVVAFLVYGLKGSRLRSR